MASRQIRALIGLVVVLGLAAVVGTKVSPIAGVVLVVIGIVAIVVVLKRTADLGDRVEPKAPKPSAKKDKKAQPPVEQGDDSLDDDSGFEDFTGSAQPLTSRQPTGPAPEPLQTWTPPEPLQAWTPPTNRSLEPGQADAGQATPAFDDNPWGTPTEADAIDDLSQPWDETTSWDDGSTWSGTTTESNPLDELDRLENLDVVAEVERLDNKGAAPTLEVVGGAFASPINEEVENPDDIMAASEATELTVGASDNTELAKLLAKVQQRLSAYE